MTQANPCWLVLLLVICVSCAGVAPADQGLVEGQTPVAQVSPRCPLSKRMAGDVISNGGFEEGQAGWSIASTGTGATWREHRLIGVEPDFEPHSGVGAARLGGYEGSSDRLEQSVVIPPDGALTYWWQIRQPRPVSRLVVSLAHRDGSQYVVLAVHRDGDAEVGWQQDCIDLSQYSGQERVLRIHVLNDNYTMTSFDIDDVSLGVGGEPQ